MYFKILHVAAVVCICVDFSLFPRTTKSQIFGDIFEGENSNSFKTNGDYFCSAAYSCYNAVALQRVNDDDDVGTVGCVGLFSCMNADLLYNNYGPIYCKGEKSCYNANIYQMSKRTSDYFDCDADRSCGYSSIHSIRDVYMSGHMSGINSKIYSYNNVTNFYLNGFQSGDGITIFCGVNKTCSLHCHATSCNNVTLICQDGTNTSCILNITCISAEKSGICPNGYNISVISDYIDIDDVSAAVLRLPTIENVSISRYDNSLVPCQNFSFVNNINVSNTSILYDPINCQLRSECRDRVYDILATTATNPGAICCSGLSSCKNGTVNMSTVLDEYITPFLYNHDYDDDDYDNDSEFDQVAIRCDAEQACVDVRNIKATNGGNIYLTGVIAAYGVESISTRSLYDIFCSGRSSCGAGVNFFGANNLYCLGQHSCAYGIVFKEVNNIWAYAERAFRSGDIGNIRSSVYCGGYQACLETTLTQIGSSVHGEGYQVLHESIMTNITNNVIVFGKEGAYGSELNGVGKNVIGIGEMVLSLTNVKNVSKVYLSLLVLLVVNIFSIFV